MSMSMSMSSTSTGTSSSDLAGLYLKDIPLWVLKDYIASDYLGTGQFQDNISLFDMLNDLYHDPTPITNGGYFDGYVQTLTDALASKYEGNYPTTLLSENDLRRASIELLGQLEIISKVLAVDTKETLTSFTGYQPSFAVLARVPRGANRVAAEQAFSMMKESFFQGYTPEDLMSDNVFINIKNSLSPDTDPSVLNMMKKMYSDFYMMLFGMNAPVMDLGTATYSLPSETITRKTVENSYDTVIQMFVQKYNGMYIQKLGIDESPEGGIKLMIRRKFQDGITEANDLDPSASPQGELGGRLSPGNVMDFLMENDAMEDYLLVMGGGS